MTKSIFHILEIISQFVLHDLKKQSVKPAYLKKTIIFDVLSLPSFLVGAYLSATLQKSKILEEQTENSGHNKISCFILVVSEPHSLEVRLGI